MKKLLCAFVAVLMLAAFLEMPFVLAEEDELPLIPAPGYQEAVRGDANGDKKANYQDALMILRHSIGLEKLSNATVKRCDVNNDGLLNYSDALKILRWSIGMEPSL